MTEFFRVPLHLPKFLCFFESSANLTMAIIDAHNAFICKNGHLFWRNGLPYLFFKPFRLILSNPDDAFIDPDISDIRNKVKCTM